MSRDETDHVHQRRAVIAGGLAGLGGLGWGLTRPAAAEADAFTDTLEVTLPNGLTPALDAILTGESEPRTRVALGALFFGAGSAPPDLAVGRIAPVGVATSGTLASGGRRYDRSAVFNVKDFGAEGDGSTADRAAIQAAIDAAAGATYPGVVFFPPGTYMVDCSSGFGLTLPNNEAICLLGAGGPINNLTSPVTIRRSGGTGTLIGNALGATTSDRFRGMLSNLNLSGNGATGRIAWFRRCGDARFQTVRFAGSAASGVTAPATEFGGMWNCAFHDCLWLGLGSGTTHPACLITDVGGDPVENSNTVFISNSIFEGNLGVDLRITSSNTWSNAIVMSNFKMERGKGSTAGSTWPFVHLEKCRQVRLTNGFITVGGSSPCTLILQDGPGGSGRNGLVNVTLEHQSATGTFYCIDQQTGTLAATGCHFDNWGSGLTTAWRIGSAVPRFGAAGAGNTYFDNSQTSHTSGKRYIDNRTGTGLPSGPVAISSEFV